MLLLHYAELHYATLHVSTARHYAGPLKGLLPRHAQAQASSCTILGWQADPAYRAS